MKRIGTLKNQASLKYRIARSAVIVVAVGAIVALGIFLAQGTATSAEANGVPQLVKLEYIESLSSWGPEDAEGVLEFSFADGFLVLDAVGLPRLIGQAYEGWLVRSATNEAISVGQFNAASDETAHYEADLPTITDYSLDLFIVTVQSLAEPEGKPSQSRSIGGFFAVIAASDDSTTARGEVTNGTPSEGTILLGDFDPDALTVAPGPDNADSQLAPAPSLGETTSAETPPSTDVEVRKPDTLPETGDSESFLANVRGGGLILVGAVLLLWGIRRTRRRVRNGGLS